MEEQNLPFEEQVKKLIASLEQEFAEHNIRFIFVVAVGSRLNQTYHENSNLNIRGFYVGNKDSYLSVMRPPKEIKINKDIKKQNQDSFYIDYEFMDIKRLLFSASQPDKQVHDSNLWLHSNIVYINQIEPQVFQQIKSQLSFPQASIVGRLIQYSKVFPNLTELNVKEVYYSLISTIQAYFYIVNGKQKLLFPDNNLYKVLSNIKINFKDEEKLATTLENLLKKYTNLKQQQVKTTNKESDENFFIEYLKQIVEKNKPLQKKQAELIEKDLKPQIEETECNDLFKKIFLRHEQYKLISSNY
ncbi:hypothetical protein ABPG74_015970 [Tetrahymena malaccensis]